MDKVFVSLGLKPPPLPAASGNPDIRVWIDARTALYYCRGEGAFGKTEKGRFAKQRDAQMDHYDPASGKPCE